MSVFNVAAVILKDLTHEKNVTVMILFCLDFSLKAVISCPGVPCCLVSLLVLYLVVFPPKTIATFVTYSCYVVHSCFWFGMLCLVFWTPIHLVFLITHGNFTFHFIFGK